jgi:SAM-dependent methyltransferase
MDLTGNRAVQAAINVVRHFPGARRLYRSLRDALVTYRLKHSSAEEIFTDIYRRNWWRGTTSVSGTGSALDQTRVIAQKLPQLLSELGVVTLLDVPCGDFHWMRTVSLGGIRYIGGDIVSELVQKNREAYQTPGIEFRRMDLLTDTLPSADLVICRDGLVHLSNADVYRAIGNLCKSGSDYLLTTTFTDRPHNADILTGDWRALNLEAPPFCFPPPLQVFNEECTELDGAYPDKSLGLWRLADLPRAAIDT